MSNYSNLPLNSKPELEATIQSFNTFYSQPIELNATAYAAIVGFFTNRGFQQSAAESISTIIMRQAKQDNYNPLKIIDTLRGLSDVEISGLVAEILNYNRYKSSSLGIAQPFITNKEIERNIGELSPFTRGSYFAEASDSTVGEGGNVVFIVYTNNVKEGTLLYWELVGDGITAADFTDSTPSGFVILEDNTFFISKILSEDILEEGDEVLYFNVRKGSSNGPLVASTSTTIVDTSRPTYSVFASTSTISEGSTVTFTILTTNLDNGTELYWYIDDIRAADVSPSVTNGIVTLVNNSATVAKTILADLSTEGTEQLTFNVTKINNTLTVKASTTTNIDDTSREIVDVAVNWTTTQTGIVNDPFQPGGWQITNDGRTIRFSVQDSANCGGPNGFVQRGTATAIIVTGSDTWKFNPVLRGFGEAEDPNFENMFLRLNGVLIRRATSAGGNLGCFPSVPVTQTVLVPGPYILPPDSVNTFTLEFSTSDPAYHIGAYYELDMFFEVYEP